MVLNTSIVVTLLVLESISFSFEFSNTKYNPAAYNVGL